MKIHKQIFKPVLLLVVSLAMMSFKTADERAAEALARRVMGGKAKMNRQPIPMNWNKRARKS